jgi:hypothetical protein
MGKFLKNFGLGLVYVLFFPVLLCAIAIAAVYGFIVCLVQFFRSAIRFFRGLEPFPPFPEDVTVESIKQSQIGLQQPSPETPAPAQPAGPSTVYVQQNYYQNGQHPAAEPPAAPAPIETTGFYNNPANPGPNPTLHMKTPPTLDVTSAPSTPSIEAKKPQGPTPAAFIDISKDDDGKDN